MDKLNDRNLPLNLKTFLTSGSLGNLSSHPTRHEVEYLLGAPNSVDKKLDIIPNQMLYVLHYDNLQITYIGEEFYQLAIYFRRYEKMESSDSLPNGLGVKWYQTVKEFDYEGFKQALLSEKIPCRGVISPYPTPQDGYTIEIISTGIWICFNSNPDSLIDSIFHTPSKPGNWQYIDIVS
ncbi:MAG: hypothetical protein ACOYNY_03015 [Caldilineaceae bacterium]